VEDSESNVSNISALPFATHSDDMLDYWDSYWIVEGLIRSELNNIAKDTLQNFMDELENIGFIPNGGNSFLIDQKSDI
jgi:hypothetical protein